MLKASNLSFTLTLRRSKFHTNILLSLKLRGREEKVCVCIRGWLRAGLSCLVIWKLSHRAPPAPGGQMVGWAARGEGPLPLILSCTCKICAMYEMRWQGSMSFNSSCTPSGSTQASCVCVSSLGSDSRDQNNMWTSRDTDHHHNKRAATTGLP